MPSTGGERRLALACLALSVVLVASGLFHLDVAVDCLVEVADFLKPVHAATLHGVLVLPAFAVLLFRIRLDEHQRVRAVHAAVAAYVVVTAALLVWVLLA